MEHDFGYGDAFGHQKFTLYQQVETLYPELLEMTCSSCFYCEFVLPNRGAYGKKANFGNQQGAFVGLNYIKCGS